MRSGSLWPNTLKTKPGFYVYCKVLALQLTVKVNHPLDAHYDSVVDEPWLSKYLVSPW
jgi:hypothetical protein